MASARNGATRSSALCSVTGTSDGCAMPSRLRQIGDWTASYTSDGKPAGSNQSMATSLSMAHRGAIDTGCPPMMVEGEAARSPGPASPPSTSPNERSQRRSRTSAVVLSPACASSMRPSVPSLRRAVSACGRPRTECESLRRQIGCNVRASVVRRSALDSCTTSSDPTGASRSGRRGASPRGCRRSATWHRSSSWPCTLAVSRQRRLCIAGSPSTGEMASGSTLLRFCSPTSTTWSVGRGAEGFNAPASRGSERWPGLARWVVDAPVRVPVRFRHLETAPPPPGLAVSLRSGGGEEYTVDE